VAFAPLGSIRRRFERFDGSTLVLLHDAVPTRLGEVVRFFSTSPPWSTDGGVMRVCLGAADLADVPVGSRMLLRIQAEDVAYLNVIRPYFAERKLRTVFWVNDAALDPLRSRAPDLMSWVFRVVEVPPRRWPEFTEEGVRAALRAGVPFVWDGEREELEALLGEVGSTEGTVELRTTMSFREMLRVLERPGLPLVVGVERDVDPWRVRMALARAGRTGAWVALRPSKALSGMWRLHARQADLDEATARLRDAGWAQAGSMAAWLDLEPERIEEAAGTVGQPPVEPWPWPAERVAVGDGPVHVLRARIGDADVAAAREQLRSGPTPEDGMALAVWAEGAEPWRDDADGAIEARLVRCLRCLGDGTPAAGSMNAAAEVGLSDVAAELGRIRFEQAVDHRADETVAWLVQYGEATLALRLANEWGARARAAGDQESLAAAQTWLGDLHARLGDGEQARRYYEDALILDKALVEREPDCSDFQSDLSVSYDRLGDLHEGLGDGEQARQYYEDALALDKALVEREPGRSDLQQGLAASYDRLGDLSERVGDREQTRRYYGDALAIRKVLAEREPARSDLKQALAVSYSKLGELHETVGDGGQARRYYEDALAIRKMLVEREPGRSDLQGALAVSFSKLGDLHAGLGDGEQARQYYEDGLAIRKMLVEREPSRSDLRRSLASSLERMALMEPEDAVSWLTQALDIRRAHLAGEPGKADGQRELAVVLARLARAWEGRGDSARAADLHREALQLLRDLHARGALEARYQPLLDRLAEAQG
jgi:tetratricopeptide (TPR) repeat protein